MKCLSVYRRPEGWYLAPMSCTTAGVWIETPPYQMLSPNEPLTVLGRTALETLSLSQHAIPHPTDWEKSPFRQMIAERGFRSVRDFMTNSASVSVEADDTRMLLLPSRNAGVRDGYITLRERGVRIPANPSDESLGHALEASILLCE